MRHPLQQLALASMVAGLLSTGCAGLMQQSHPQSAYDQQRGTLTVSVNNRFYQSRGEALPLRDDQMVKVATAEGYDLYRLKGGGGGRPGPDVLYVKTTAGDYLTLIRVQP
jgi:hypothetical protein